MDEPPFSLAFVMVKESFVVPAILFYLPNLASDASKNKRPDHLRPRPLGFSLYYPAVSGGRDILLGDRFRTKLAYTPPLLTTSVELGWKKS
jgi:hypothetical protein